MKFWQVDFGIRGGRKKNNSPGGQSVGHGFESCTLFEVLQILIGLLSVWLGLLWRLVVRVVHFEEPLTSSFLILSYLLRCMRPHILMHFDVAGDTQQLTVGGIVCQSLHLLHRAPCLHRLDVVHIHTWGDEAFSLAQLAQAIGTSEHLGSQQLPSLVVQ